MDTFPSTSREEENGHIVSDLESEGCNLRLSTTHYGRTKSSTKTFIENHKYIHFFPIVIQVEQDQPFSEMKLQA